MPFCLCGDKNDDLPPTEMPRMLSTFPPNTGAEKSPQKQGLLHPKPGLKHRDSYLPIQFVPAVEGDLDNANPPPYISMATSILPQLLLAKQTVEQISPFENLAAFKTFIFLDESPRLSARVKDAIRTMGWVLTALMKAYNVDSRLFFMNYINTAPGILSKGDLDDLKFLNTLLSDYEGVGAINDAIDDYLFAHQNRARITKLKNDIMSIDQQTDANKLLPDQKLHSAPQGQQTALQKSAEQTASFYENAEKVPGTDQYIYLQAQVLISRQYHERYLDLVDHFKGAVENHKVLKYHTKNISYALHLCGNSSESAAPSIVIFCLKSIFKDLHSLLRKRHNKLQYEPPDSTFEIIPFKLIFFRCPCSPVARKAGLHEVHAYGRSRFTVCGSQLKYKDHISTLGVLLSVDSKLYGLTVDHLFKDEIVSESDVALSEKDFEAHDDELWSLDLDDVKYDNIDYDAEASYAPLAKDEITMANNVWTIAGYKVEQPHKLGNSQAYLDWALVDLYGGYKDRPNAFYLENDLEHPKFFSGISRTPKFDETPEIYMISASSGIRTGILLPGIALISGEPGEDLCQAWNVILSDSRGIRDGDCGSIIVKKDTFEIYGHVVASNPLGEAYVVSLQHTFDQIRTALGAKDVSLPNPGLSLANMVHHYLSTGDSIYAEKARTSLISIIATDKSSVKDALRSAAKHWNFTAIETILTIYYELQKQTNTKASLLQAIIQGLAVATQMPLDTGAGSDSPNHLWKTALEQAATGGHLEITRLVLEQIPNPEIQDKDSRTPLLLAAEYGQEAVVKLLLEKGADLESKSSNGRTPLSYSAGKGHEAVLKLLLEKGAELGTKDTEGQTPLSWAAGNGHKAVVKLLLEKSAEKP